MKHYFNRNKPNCLIEDWPGKYDTFSWLEFGITIPNPIYIVTTLKEGDIPNANIQSWGLLLGEGEHNHFLLAMLKHHHTYENIMRTGEWCINYISKEYLQQSCETIKKNGYATDEIAASGLTAVQSKVVKTPIIAESTVALECSLKWEQSLIDNSRWSLLCGEIVQIAIDDTVLLVEPEKRIAAMNLMYNIRGTVNPLNGDYHSANTFGLLGEIIHYAP